MSPRGQAGERDWKAQIQAKSTGSLAGLKDFTASVSWLGHHLPRDSAEHYGFVF